MRHGMLIDLWNERATTLEGAAGLVKKKNPELAENLAGTALAYKQCADELQGDVQGGACND